jgi:hypothetical protein
VVQSLISGLEYESVNVNLHFGNTRKLQDNIMLGRVAVYATFCDALSLYRDGQNNTNARYYRNKIVCVSYTERRLVVSIFLSSFVCLSCVVPVSKHYR